MMQGATPAACASSARFFQQDCSLHHASRRWCVNDHHLNGFPPEKRKRPTLVGRRFRQMGSSPPPSWVVMFNLSSLPPVFLSLMLWRLSRGKGQRLLGVVFDRWDHLHHHPG